MCTSQQQPSAHFGCRAQLEIEDAVRGKVLYHLPCDALHGLVLRGEPVDDVKQREAVRQRALACADAARERRSVLCSVARRDMRAPRCVSR